jgi:hypothetical protein
MDRDVLEAVGIGAAIDASPIPMRLPHRPRFKPTLKAVLQDRLPLTPVAKTALRKAGRDLRRDRPIPPQKVLLKLLDLKMAGTPVLSCSPRLASIAITSASRSPNWARLRS